MFRHHDFGDHLDPNDRMGVGFPAAARSAELDRRTSPGCHVDAMDAFHRPYRLPSPGCPLGRLGGGPSIDGLAGSDVDAFPFHSLGIWNVGGTPAHLVRSYARRTLDIPQGGWTQVAAVSLGFVGHVPRREYGAPVAGGLLSLMAKIDTIHSEDPGAIRNFAACRTKHVSG